MLLMNSQSSKLHFFEDTKCYFAFLTTLAVPEVWSSGLPVSWRRCEIRLASTSRRGERFQHLSRSLIFSLALALARRLPPPPRRPPGPSRLPAATPDPPAHPQPRRPCPAPPFLCVSCPPFAVPSTNGAASPDRVPLSLRLHLLRPGKASASTNLF